MTKEELDSIEELIERKITLAEVTGGLTSSDKKFIALWNYTMQLQNNGNELKKWLEEEYEYCDKIGNPAIGCAMGQIKRIKSKMQELENSNNDI